MGEWMELGSFKKNKNVYFNLFQGLNKEGDVLRITPQLPRTMCTPTVPIVGVLFHALFFFLFISMALFLTSQRLAM